MIATFAPGWAIQTDAIESSPPSQEEWKSVETTAGEKIYVRPIYHTTVVREDATTKPCPKGYKGQVNDYQKKGYIVGDGKINPSKDRRPVAKWEQSLGIGRVVEKQKIRDAGQDEAIAGKLDTTEFDQYTKTQSELDREQKQAILANSREISAVWYWVAGILFVAGLALTILFLALRWYWAGAIAGALTFIGLLVLAIIYLGIIGIAIVALIGLIAMGVILWYIYPSFQGPVPIPPPAMAGGGPIAVSRPAVI